MRNYEMTTVQIEANNTELEALSRTVQILKKIASIHNLYPDDTIHCDIQLSNLLTKIEQGLKNIPNY